MPRRAPHGSALARGPRSCRSLARLLRPARTRGTPRRSRPRFRRGSRGCPEVPPHPPLSRTVQERGSNVRTAHTGASTHRTRRCRRGHHAAGGADSVPLTERHAQQATTERQWTEPARRCPRRAAAASAARSTCPGRRHRALGRVPQPHLRPLAQPERPMRHRRAVSLRERGSEFLRDLRPPQDGNRDALYFWLLVIVVILVLRHPALLGIDGLH